MSAYHERPQTASNVRLAAPIVPRASIAGRALVAVVAIMTFLASLSTGAVLLVQAAASEWQADVAREMTIQVRPDPPRDIAGDAERATLIARATAGIADVRIFSQAESAQLLEPWLGTGLKLDDLPVPRMIIVRALPGSEVDLEGLRAALKKDVPNATLDDHRAWMSRMRVMTRTALFAGLGVLVLVVAATIISVSFATRGAMAANRPIVEVLHFVGAGDRFIANRFLRHFLQLGLEGGIIGCGAAMLIFGFSEALGGWMSGTAAGDQLNALLGTFSLRPSGYVMLIVQAIIIAGITAFASRRTLYATLASIE
jgi:cell division transport system permease protein